MNIGIITQPLHKNYGGLLQNYALQTLLKQLGHTPITFNQRLPHHNGLKTIKANIKTAALRVINRGKDRQFLYIHSKKTYDEVEYGVKSFVDDNILTTRPIYNRKDLELALVENRVDAFIVGSDQVWRPKYTTDLGMQFLDFINDSKTKRISYAASFGTDVWEYNDEQTQKCADLLKKFDLVTVRENTGVYLCKEHLNINAELVLDPTLMLDPEDYLEIINNSNEQIAPGTMFCYILDESDNKKMIIDRIAASHKLHPEYLRIGSSIETVSARRIHFDTKRYSCPSVSHWLKSLKESELVITDSFHAVAFSILFNKPFWVIGNNERGLSRITSILSMFELEDRLLHDGVENIMNDPGIDWDIVNKTRNLLCNRSKALLTKSLG